MSFYWKHFGHAMAVVAGCCALHGVGVLAQTQPAPKAFENGYVKPLSNVPDNDQKTPNARRLRVIESTLGLTNLPFYFSLPKDQKLVVRVIVERNGKLDEKLSSCHSITAEDGADRNAGPIDLTICSPSLLIRSQGLVGWTLNINDKYLGQIPIDATWIKGNCSSKMNQYDVALDEAGKQYDLWTFKEPVSPGSNKLKFQFRITCAREPVTKDDEPGTVRDLKK